ncbi:hypothetical protein ACFL38_04925 [Candidatus Omnitrophota bacterium]
MQRTLNACFAIGLIFILLGLVCNEWAIAKIFSPDGIFETVTRKKIYVFDLVCITLGLVVIKYRKRITHIFEVLPTVVRSHSLLRICLINVFFAVTIWFCFELIFFTLNSYDAHKVTLTITENNPKDFYQPDDLLGYKPKPNSKFAALLKVDTNTIYNVTYSIDNFSRRITPVVNTQHRNSFILFFGDSFTFGIGVSDNETLPSYVAELASQHMPYNYGFPAYGPQTMLAKLQSGTMRKEIAEREGIAVYTFIDDHILRATGSFALHSFIQSAPYFMLTSDGRLIRKDTFASGRPFLSFLHRTVGKSQVLKYFPINAGLPIINKDIKVTCRIIEESHRAFKEQFKNSDFYVIFYPGSRYASTMIPHLTNVGIHCLDYSDVFNCSKEEFRISVYDVHPTAKAHRVLAKQLMQDIAKLQTQRHE